MKRVCLPCPHPALEAGLRTPLPSKVHWVRYTSNCVCEGKQGLSWTGTDSHLPPDRLTAALEGENGSRRRQQDQEPTTRQTALRPGRWLGEFPGQPREPVVQRETLGGGQQGTPGWPAGWAAALLPPAWSEGLNLTEVRGSVVGTHPQRNLCGSAEPAAKGGTCHPGLHSPSENHRERADMREATSPSTASLPSVSPAGRVAEETQKDRACAAGSAMTTHGWQRRGTRAEEPDSPGVRSRGASRFGTWLNEATSANYLPQRLTTWGADGHATSCSGHLSGRSCCCSTTPPASVVCHSP